MYLLKSKTATVDISTHRYHRLRAIDLSHNAGYPYDVEFFEIRLYDQLSQAGNEFALSGTASASDFFGTGYEAYRANNNNLSDRWASSTASVLKNFTIDSLSSLYALKSLSVYPNASASGSFMPKAFVLEGSDDNTNWDYLGFCTSTNITSPAWQHYNVIRLKLSATNTTLTGLRELYGVINSYEPPVIVRAIYPSATKKVYFEIVVHLAGNPCPVTVSVMGHMVLNNTYSVGICCAIDFEEGKLWSSVDTNVNIAGVPNLFKPNSQFEVIFSSPYCLNAFNFNFGHYPDTPFGYAIPATFERWL